jgi:hypothetical protein
MTSISALWATLDTTVQQWLLQNPGTMVLPRTHVNRIEAGAVLTLRLDDHGELWLSPEDMMFLKGKRNEAQGAPVGQEAGEGRSVVTAGADSRDRALDQ